MTVQLVAPPGVNQFYGMLGTLYIADANGIFTVQNQDVGPFLDNGAASYGVNRTGNAYLVAPLAQSVGAIVAAATLANGGLTITAQPDYARKLNLVLTTTGGTLTSGGTTLIGTNNKGATVTEVFSHVGRSAAATLTTSNAFSSLTSAAHAGLAGTVTMSMSIGNGLALALPVPPNATALSVFKENVDNANEAVGTVDTAAGTVQMTTAPNGTHSYSLGYSYVGA